MATEDLQSYRILSLLPNRLSQDVVSWRSYDEETLLKNAVEVGLLPTILPKVLSYMIDTKPSETNADRYDYYSMEENEMNSKARKIQIKMKRNFLKSVLIASFMNFFSNSITKNNSNSGLSSKGYLQLERLALCSKTISDSISHKFNRKLSDELSKYNQSNSSSRIYSQKDANSGCSSKPPSKNKYDEHSSAIDSSSQVPRHRAQIPRDWSADYNDIEFEMIQVMENSQKSKEELNNNNNNNSNNNISSSANNEISDNNNIVNSRSPGKKDIDGVGDNLSNRSYGVNGDVRGNKIKNERTTIYQNQSQSNSQKSDLNLISIAEIERQDVGESADRSSKSNSLNLVKSNSSKSLNKSPSREFLSNVSTFIAASAISTFMLSSSISSSPPPSPSPLPLLSSCSHLNETALYTDTASNSNNDNFSNSNSNGSNSINISNNSNSNSNSDGGPAILERYGMNEIANSNWTLKRKIILFMIYLCLLGSIFFYQPSLIYSLVAILASIAVSILFGYQLFYYDLFYYRQGYMPI